MCVCVRVCECVCVCVRQIQSVVQWSQGVVQETEQRSGGTEVRQLCGGASVMDTWIPGRGRPTVEDRNARTSNARRIL